MKLTGSQLEQVINALISGYDSESELEMMVRLKLDLNLNVIVDGENLRETVFELVTWAEERGRIDDLIVGAQEFNDGNPDLQQLLNDYIAWRATQQSSKSTPTPHNYSDNTDTDSGDAGAGDAGTSNAERGKLGWVAILATLGAVVIALAVVLSNFLPNPNNGREGPLQEETAAQVADSAETPTSLPTATATTAPITSTSIPSHTPVAQPSETPTPLPSHTPTPQPVDPAQARLQVQAIIDSEVALGNQRDLTGILGLLAPEIRIINRSRTLNDTSDDLIFDGHAGANEFYSGFFALEWGSYSLLNVEVTPNGDEATATHQGVVSDGVLFRDFATYRLKKSNGEWKITEIEVGTMPAE